MNRDDQIWEGEAFEKIRGDLNPLERLLRRKRDDLFAQWAADEKLSKDYCKGVLSVLDSLMSDIDELIENAQKLREEDEELFRIERSPALEGGGHGDLAS